MSWGAQRTIDTRLVQKNSKPIHPSERHLAAAFHHAELDDIPVEIRRASQRIASALIRLGLYIALVLALQQNLGSRLGDFSLLAGAGCILAGWLIYHMVRVLDRDT